MKVTVCFGSTKVIVPCGQGELFVSELIEKSTTRYKKAIGKPQDYWVSVISLKCLGDGGILDLDDQLKDVTDDREQIVAIYEEQEAPPVPHNGGDGTSASSIGTSSPDIFQGAEYNNNKQYGQYLRHSNHHDVVITQNDLNTAHNGSSLIVRRGSEPTLTKLISDDSKSFHPDFCPQKPCIKQWSAITSIDEVKSRTESEANDENESDSPPPTLERVEGIGQEEDQNSHNSSFSTFSRGSSRRSLANNAAMLKWLDAQEKAQEQYEVKPGRREPLGGRSDDEFKITTPPPVPTGKQGQMVILQNSAGPLGIHVVPELDNNTRERGLLIQSVEEGGRVHRDGRIAPRDVIIEINGTSLSGVDFAKAQEIFRQSLHAEALQLLIMKAPPPLPSQPPPKDRALSPIRPTSRQNTPDQHSNTDQNIATVTATQLQIKPSDADDESSSPESPTRGPPPPVPARNPNTALTSTRFVATNTRKLGKRIHIQLTKGPQGLGFSVTTRDNPTGGHVPIYIKNILPKGAAIEDGNLIPGDRLLEVNGIEMTGKTQTEAVTVLRNTKMGGVVNLVVSRQIIDDDEENTSSNSSGVQKSENLHNLDNSTDTKETLIYDVSMDDAESYGLGLNVKAKTSTTQDGVIKDLGIFVKAIIDGGAAAKDGRIKVNDQLLEVNGDKLLGKSNPEAMEVLRDAVKKESSKPGCIRLVLMRKVDNSRVPSIHEARISQSDNNINSTTDLHNNQPANSIKSHTNALLARVKREQSLRNTSYQIANHDSLVNETLQDSVFVPPANKPKAYGLTISAKNISNPEGSSVLIQADSPSAIRMRSNSSSSATRVRPASTLGFMTSEPDSRIRLSVSKSNQDLLDGDSKWLKEWDKSGDVIQDEKSPVEDTDPSTAFQREGFGRQSMSEKRKGHVDPRLTEFYQKIKSSKESGSSQYLSASWDPRRSAFQQIEGPSRDLTALKRVASAESLLSSNRLSVHAHPSFHQGSNYEAQYLNSEARYLSSEARYFNPETRYLDPETRYQIPETRYSDPDARSNHHQFSFHCPPPRSCLVPFLSQPCLLSVAADEVGPVLGLKKSTSLESLQKALQEDETPSGAKNGQSQAQRGRGINESFRAAVDRSYEQTGEAMETVQEEGSEAGSVSQDGRSRTSSFSGPEAEKRSKKTKKEKEKGLFKGFFKLSKNKKSESKAKSTEELLESERTKPEAPKHIDDREWLHKQRQMAAEKQRLAEQQEQREERQQLDQLLFQHPVSPPHSSDLPVSRADKIQQLRLEHQRRHRERQGQYPQDAEEERHIQELERQKTALRNASESSYYSNVSLPPRQQYEDSMKYERARPAFVEGDHYSHYQNIQEIQTQLRKHDQYQHRYHQQPPGGYTPGHYTREVNMPPPTDPRYHQRAYATPHTRDPHHNDVIHYGYYTPQHAGYRSGVPLSHTPASHMHTHTPASQNPYTSHSALAKNTPQIIINAAPHDYPRQRAYSEFDPEVRTVYRDPPYGSLPRRHRDMPGSAQV